jgi:hypothetical protein
LDLNWQGNLGGSGGESCGLAGAVPEGGFWIIQRGHNDYWAG